MKALNRLILLAGVLTLAALLWHFKPSVIWADVSQVGMLGLVVILSFQICDHTLNALGWRFAFRPDEAGRVPLPLLVRVRIAGDGVNYLTPSGQIAGELVRPGLLGDVLPSEAKNSSVAVAKFAQALGQAAFIIVGLFFVVLGKTHILSGRELWLSALGPLLVAGLIGLGIFLITRPESSGRFLWGLGGPAVETLRGQMRGYLRAHPGRFVLSTFCFTLGYGWGMLEVLLITRFMGLRLSAIDALAVETLSNVVDAAMFMVPGKVGTQEAGKTAIFELLGLPAGQGLAFGLIRHLRELVWASGGFLLYTLSWRKGAPPRGSSGAAPGPRASAALGG